MADSRLFKPLKVGNVTLQARLAMAPMTRLRASPERIPTALMKEHYGQRAAIPGILLVSEGTLVSPASAGGFERTPGMWTEEQVAGWRTVTDEVHGHGCAIFCQLFAMGRSATKAVAKAEGVKIVAPSALPIDDSGEHPTPAAMTMAEIQQTVADFVTAAQNAIRSGFDGVEIHAGNGYLLDQFLQSNSNHRTDDYGGSVENRSRIVHEILSATVGAIGASRVGLRVSPWSTFQGMRMPDPVPQFSDIIRQAANLGIAFLHLVEPRICGVVEVDTQGESLDFAYAAWNSQAPILVAGGFKGDSAQKLVDQDHPDKDIVVVFGRYFISNPDLVLRIRQNIPLAEYDRDTFYTNNSKGYTDYPFSDAFASKSL